MTERCKLDRDPDESFPVGMMPCPSGRHWQFEPGPCDAAAHGVPVGLTGDELAEIERLKIALKKPGENVESEA